MKKHTQTWGVFKIPTREARIFAGMKEELVSKPTTSQQEALDLADNLRMSGYYDETTSTYTVKPIKN